MLKSNGFRLVRDSRLSVPILRHFHHEFTQSELQKLDKDKKNTKPGTGAKAEKVEERENVVMPGAINQKYTIFRDEDATEIFDVEEERYRYQVQDKPEESAHSHLHGINLTRGLHGVYDIEELVDVLRKENANDIFVCSVPKDFKYVDHMVVCSGRSYRHMLAIAEFVRRIFKTKRKATDILPKIEGEKSREWMALDLGNIALHIFSSGAREIYDLESLWAIGSEYDKESNKPQDPLVELFEKHSTLLADIKSGKISTDS